MSRYIPIFNIFGDNIYMKIYDYNGKKNICGDRIHEARCKLD